jgi:hypothetical protein
MSDDDLDKLKTQIAYLESDVERLTREARERDKVINELYMRIDALEEGLKHVVANSAGHGIRLSESFSEEDDRGDYRLGLEEMHEPALDP